MKLLLLITARLEKGVEVAEAWQKTGAPGLTIIPSHGLYRLQQDVRGGVVELPRMVVSMADAMIHVLRSREHSSETIISVVPDELVDPLIAAAESVLGDLKLPNNGVLFVLDVERALGVHQHGE